ncbi:[NU+] prion formation protein 1 [Metarhizium acridum]|nr:[NU+] prion formation protein 1 [Metarhizium acridum]
MTNVSYTYPNAPKPSLSDVSCQLTLSSRVAIIGPNGAGKSTLIKLLTGETIPGSGKVEKHPNLRIGYIKQHALEHVEMHLEKTPNQYLQWRYANGDDREDGKSPRQVESLVGRQKYKKTFQYEVKWRGLLPKHNTMVSRETLTELGSTSSCKSLTTTKRPAKVSATGSSSRPFISKHFEDLGLEPEIANHTKSAPSRGGQKVKGGDCGRHVEQPAPPGPRRADQLPGPRLAGRPGRRHPRVQGRVILISHNEEFVGALCSGDSRPAAPSPAPPPAPSSAAPVNSGVEDNSDMKFRARKKKKMTKKELKEREVRRRLRHIDWLNSPKGTPHPPDTDDEDN